MQVLNSKGEPIVLSQREQMLCDYNQQIVNSLGYEVNITTLTQIMKKVTEQKFFQIKPSDFMPVKVGEGAYSTSLLTYRSFALGDNFADGVIGTGTANSLMASADAGVDAVTVKVNNWAKKIGWSLFDLQFAMKSGNWDLITAKEKARKQNWDLGIQSVAFLGLPGDSGTLGFLNQSGVTINTTLIRKAISVMSAAELNTFCAAVLQAYRVNCSYTAMPDLFTIPESDFNGLAALSDPTFPVRTKLSILEETFRLITMKPNFKIRPLAYATAAQSSGVLSVNRYVLSTYDEESLRLDIPVDYTNTLANSTDNFSFQNVGFGQFTGAKVYRAPEMFYMDETT